MNNSLLSGIPLTVLGVLNECFKWRRRPQQQVLSQPAKRRRHLCEQVVFMLDPTASKQLQLGATKVTSRQMLLNADELVWVHKRAPRGKHRLRTGTLRALAKWPYE